jgi:glycosyltransferase involved in cell wall biosynthesis
VPSSVPTITAVVPAYNYARFLPEALDSLLGQTVPFGKIVVVDDGSTDDTPEVLARYAGRVEAVRISNSGQLGACVEGLGRTTSDYVYFMDADDYVPRDFVQTLLPLLSDRPDKVQFQLRGVDVDGVETGSVFPTYPPGYGSAQAKNDNNRIGFYICPPTSGNVYRCETLRAVDFGKLNPRDFIDGTPTLVMPYLGSIKSINVPLAYYRVHQSSHSQYGSPDRKLLERELKMFRDRWDEAATALKGEQTPSPGAAPAYVLERELMLAALEGRAAPPRTIAGFASKIARSNLPAKQKVFLAGWAGSFLLPGAGMRRYAIKIRRSPSSRPRFLQHLVRRVLRA